MGGRVQGAPSLLPQEFADAFTRRLGLDGVSDAAFKTSDQTDHSDDAHVRCPSHL